MRSTLLRGAYAYLLAAGALVLGCGGGGDDGGGGMAGLLSGTYHFVGMEAETDGTAEVTSSRGSITSDGAGTLSATTTACRNGDVETPSTQTDIPYTIAGDRTLTIIDPMDPSAAMAVGRISADGSLALLGTLQDGASPGVWLTVRRSGTFSAASMSGWYTTCRYLYYPGGDTKGSDVGGLEFDGIDSAVGGFDTNRDGHQSGAPTTATYAVTASGTLDLIWTPLTTDRGGILAGGDIALLAGPTEDGVMSALMACIRRTTGATNALLSGEYFVTGLEFDLDESEFRSSTGTFTADGAGNYTVVMRDNIEGVVDPTPSTSTGTYSVEASGALIINAGATMEGQVSPGGSFAVVGGGTVEDDDPMIYFLLR